jgi:hypothetical protein
MVDSQVVGDDVTKMQVAGVAEVTAEHDYHVLMVRVLDHMTKKTVEHQVIVSDTEALSAMQPEAVGYLLAQQAAAGLHAALVAERSGDPSS